MSGTTTLDLPNWLALQKAKNAADGIGDNLLIPPPAATRSVGAERLNDTYAGMPSPDVSPVIGAYGAHPVTAATRSNALDIASAASQFGPADMASIRAFHGSPYDFHAFDTSKIGTGEGAQAYGHGLYFAEKEGTAKFYRDALSGKPTVSGVHVDGVPAEDAGLSPSAIALAKMHLDGFSTLDALRVSNEASLQRAKEALQRMPNSSVGIANRDLANRALDALDELKGRALTFEEPKLPGHMYEVSLNTDPEHFLDWNKPLSKQPDTFAKLPSDIQERMRRFGQKSKIDWGDLGAGTNADDYATGQTLVKHLTDKFGDPAKTSAMLHAAGIPGIKYLDQGSRSSGQGTSNYVIFDPKTIEILRKYGIAGLMAGGAAAASTSSQDQQ